MNEASCKSSCKYSTSVWVFPKHAMACTDSPRASESGLDHLLKNAEFENVQQTKAIKTERETIQAYEQQLEEKERQTAELEKSILDLDEQAKKLHKLFTFSRDNYESLRRTSTVLSDHEEALKRKFYATQKEVEEECSQQKNALAKYRNIWATYQAKYDNMDKVQELKREQQEIQLLSQKNVELDAQIGNLEDTLKHLKMEKCKRGTLSSWVIQLAQLRVDSDQHLKCMKMDCNLLKELQTDISQLRENVTRSRTKLKELEKAQEKRQLLEQQQTQNTPHNVHDTTDEIMETQNSSMIQVDDTNSNSTAEQSHASLSPVHQQQIASEKQSISITTPHVAVQTPQSSNNMTRANTLQKNTASLISLPQIKQRTKNTPSTTHSTMTVSSLRYKLSVPTLNIPSRASHSGSKSTSPSIGQHSKQLPQIPAIQRYSHHSTVSSPLSVTTVAKGNSVTQPSVKTTTITRPQLTLQTPVRPSSAVTVPNQPSVPSLPRPLSSLLQMPSANSNKSTHKVPVISQVCLPNDHVKSTMDTSLKDVDRESNPTAINDCESHVENTNSTSVSQFDEGQLEQSERVEGMQTMDTETTSQTVTTREHQPMEHSSRTDEAKRQSNETSTLSQQHIMDTNNEQDTSIAIAEATVTPNTEMEQLPDMNALFSLQGVGDNNSTSTNNITFNTQVGGQYTEPNSNATVGDHGYVQSVEFTETETGNQEVFENQVAFGGDQMMFPVGDNGMQFYATTNEANYGGDFFSFDGPNEQATSGIGFSFGAPSGTPSTSQGDNTGFAFSFGGSSSTPASDSGASFFNF